MTKVALSPETELAVAHIRWKMTDLVTVWTICGCFLLVMSLGDAHYAPSIGTDSLSFNELIASQPNRAFAQHNNGTKFYYEWNNDTRKFIYKEVGDAYEEFVKGMYRYDYGGTWNNFCWPRNDTHRTTDELESPYYAISLFRAFQLRPFSQVFIRFALLITFNFRVFVAYLLVQRKKAEYGASFWRICVCTSVILLTTVEIISGFLLTDLQIFQDEKISFLLPISFHIFAIAIVFKSVLMSSVSKNMMVQPLRLLFSIAIIATMKAIYDGMKEYLEHPYCDAYVSLWTAIPEYMFILSTAVLSILELLECCHLEIVISSTPEDVDVIVKGEFQEEYSPVISLKQSLLIPRACIIENA